jgi:predicted ATPase
MIREFTIENFKSIESLTLPLGRVTVLIGENGAGKSNVLEAMAYFAGAAHQKLDAEFLVTRGVRPCSQATTPSCFQSGIARSFRTAISSTRANGTCDLTFSPPEDKSSEDWVISRTPKSPLSTKEEIWSLKFSLEELAEIERAAKILKENGGVMPDSSKESALAAKILPVVATASRRYRNMLAQGQRLVPTPFVIFSPENTALRTFEAEGQMRPLGVRGEGLFKLVQQFAEHQPAKFKLLRRELKLFDWFEDFAIPKRLGIGESRLEIKDRFLAAKRLLDQRSANEGFLFLLFYLCLFLSPQTPKFFAIDNIDASLNPKLCAEMMRRLVALAKQEDKQVIITTHNPAILDGLDLTDKEQLLYAIQRDEKGRTIAQRIPAPKPQRGEPALKLSHAYLRGLLGGVPKNF